MPEEKRLLVAFQGELGAYSELAARAFFPGEIDVLPAPSFDKVFQVVEEGACDYGIIPIENSLAGSIHQNYDLLLKHDLLISGEIKLRISHNLIVNPGLCLKEVRRIYSHPQALSQCDDFIKELPDVEVVPVYDTAGAVKMIKEEAFKDAGAIASAQAAVDYGLEILESGIESNHQNFTRFLIISEERMTSRPGSDPKTSIVFSLPNVPASLFKSLSVFALRDINLLKIESRPVLGRPWEYFFYLDFEGDAEDSRCFRALEHLKEIATFLRVLGSYQKGRDAAGRIRPR